MTKQITVNVSLEKEKTEAVVEVLYDSSNYEKATARFGELATQYPENYLAIYDLLLDNDLNIFSHSPSVFIGKEEFE
ncbi:phosphoribosylaminoimidazole carboxylase [Streptococcus sp. Marseille-Q5855]|uniref:phosphoribosylaminoimidazole carboxylase n=1 Tax=Streptococcus sp. Marseille-Q5855 TaxID=2972781 RepID=UPI0021C8FA2A|nr:phosphoribosylaminoimidazole carboxylase [Streptococcus sp. Marseille-Q5855]